MHHGSINKNTARGLKELRRRISRARIPPSRLDENITIATWNIREFGRRPRRLDSLHYIAEILGQFDLIAIVEVRDNLSDLERALEFLGPYWHVVFSDFITDPGGNRERIAYVYDRRAVTFTGLAAEADAPRHKEGGEYVQDISWWRAPFMASFRAGDFDFILISAHIRWGSSASARVKPLQTLAEWIAKRRQEKHVIDKDIVLLGDFNIPSTATAAFRAITSGGLRIPKALRGVHGTNLSRNKRYDQILHYPASTDTFTGLGGDLDFFAGGISKLYPGVTMSKTKFTYQLSDHLPLWAQINVDLEDEKLDQVLKA